MNKEIIEYKRNFFSKIKNFLKKLFSRENSHQEHMDNYVKVQNNNFKQDIQLKQDDEEIKIRALKKQYKEGKIKEEDMSDEEHKKLIQLYELENQKLREKIQFKKQKIKRKLDELKV